MLFILPLRFKLASLIIVTVYMASFCQSFGGLKPGLGWKQINTDTCRIIFPGHLEEQAQRVANFTHYLKKHHVEEIGNKAFKIDILLNNQTTVSNGFVSIAPWKSHFVTTPLQDNYQLTALPWLDLLALHEYRHVIQLSSARRGIVNILYYLFGQEAWAGAANLSIPNWFTEGDAVWAETTQSSQGRGRVSSFLEGYRALKISDTKYSYAKARNGSLKHFVPDHYRLGYLMVQYGHRKYGEDFWKEIMLDAAAYKGIFYPFANAMKRVSGMTPKTMYDAMWKEIAIRIPDKPEVEPNSMVITRSDTGNFIDHQYPHLPDDSSIVFFERSYDQIGRFRKYDFTSGALKTITTKGISIEPYYGGEGRYLTWTEYSTASRWIENDYCDLIIYDLQTDRKRRVTRRGKFFSPQPSTDGKSIICVQNDHNVSSNLCLINTMDGTIQKEMSHTGWQYTYPQFWQGTDKIISAIRDSDGKMALVECNLSNGDERLITPFLNRIIGIPEIYDSIVFYSASTADVENIFGTNLYDGNTYQYTHEPNGAFQPSVNGKSIYYVTQTANGHVIKKIDRTHRELENNVFEFQFEKNLLDSVPDETYTVTKYPTLAKAFNLHTWGLIVEDPEIIARVLSNNVLNNMEVSAGVKYNYDQQNYRPFARLALAAWYPTIDIEVDRLNRSQTIENTLRSWTETNLGMGLSVDWNLLSGTYLRRLSPLIALNHTILNGDFDLSFSSMASQITFQQQKIKARKNIFTHSGQYLQLRYSRSIDDFSAEQFQVRSGLVFRGIGVNHNMMLQADYKSDLAEAEYQFSSGFNHRGYGVIPGHQVLRLSADYHLPLFYPDVGIAGLIYFYRIRLNPFYEFSRINDPSENVRTYQSVGTEVVFDLNLVNEVPLSLGLRLSQPLDKKYLPAVEVFIPVYRF